MKTAGILGGMGPAATVDFYGKIVSHTPAFNDQEHVPVVMYADPRIPDRTAFLLGRGSDPYPSLLRGARRLRETGADFIAIPCNTAHYWQQKLSADVAPTPVLHIVDAAIKDARERGCDTGRLGVLATEGTIQGGVYGRKLAEEGFEAVFPDAEGQAQVTLAIAAVKAGDVRKGRFLLEAQARNLLDRNCGKVIMGCTEIPVALGGADIGRDCIDATDALAREVVRTARGE